MRLLVYWPILLLPQGQQAEQVLRNLHLQIALVVLRVIRHVLHLPVVKMVGGGSCLIGRILRFFLQKSKLSRSPRCDLLWGDVTHAAPLAGGPHARGVWLPDQGIKLRPTGGV